MSSYKTPGVYVEERSAFGSSVVAAETAIPVFIGYTSKSVDRNGKNLEKIQGQASIPVKIRSLLEFRQFFGSPLPMKFSVDITAGEDNPSVLKILEDPYCQLCTLFYNLKLYFDNGGGPCYIVSIGLFAGDNGEPTSLPDNAKQQFEDGLTAADSEDEITLYLLPEAVHLKPREYYSLVARILTSCQKLQDRFSVVDVLDSAALAQLAVNRGVTEGNILSPLDIVGDSKEFRAKVNSDFLNRGAAYYPFLKTSIPHEFLENEVTITVEGGEEVKNLEEFGAPTNSYASRDAHGKTLIQYVSEGHEVAISAGPDDGLEDENPIQITVSEAEATLKWKGGISLDAFKSAWMSLEQRQNFRVNLKSITATILSGAEPLEFRANASNSKIYNLVKEQIKNRMLILPPSAAIVGAYARIDGTRGIWNAPANTAVQSVIEAQRKIDAYTQQNLNVDGVSGKSINAIRSFPGKGNLIWGARTLAGNDNDWRYINVRRLFTTVEENCKKATEFSVFEPNTAVTWAKVKAMLKSYFFGLYQNGALVGASPDQAYYVKVGLGETMTPQDILEGIMKVEIGLCPSRPAEFIILTFTQILQES